MPLSIAVNRKHIYARTIQCHGFLRDDGLWDIEGEVRDARSYGSHMDFRGDIPPGATFHQMAIRMTIDEEMSILAIEAVMDGTPYGVCSGVTPNYQRLVGLKLGKGFTKAIRERLGGPEGCTHLRELLGPMTTTAFQSILNYRREIHEAVEETARERLLDSCYALSRRSAVVKFRWPNDYTG